MHETIESDVRIPGHGGDTLAGRLARPDGAGPWPAVVLVHEVYGPTPHVVDLLRRLAGEGFVAAAPDLWTREAAALPPAEADLRAWKAFVEGIPDERMIGDLAAAARFLQARPEVRRDAVGAVGLSMGGIYAFHLACEEGTPIRACVDFYGRVRYDAATPLKPRSNLDRAGELRCPLLAIFGAMDHLVPLEDVLALKEAVAGRGSVVAYPRAGHGFLDGGRSSYREEEAADAWRRAVLFLRERLAPDTLPADAPPSVPVFREAGNGEAGGGRGGGRRRRRGR